MTEIAHLTDRAVLEVTGEDRAGFLQGLVSNDVALVGPGRAVWAALLTPQGKWVADFFVVAGEGRLLMDVEAGQAEMLVAKLMRYRLRARVAVARTGLAVVAGWGGDGPGGSFADPRVAGAGWRWLTEDVPAGVAGPERYDVHRLGLGLPGGSADMEAEKTTLLEAGFDELGGVSWTKGCYMGQELTARTKYRGLLKRRLVPVRAAGGVPAFGTPVMAGGAEVGVMRSGRGEVGLALLRVDAAGRALECGGVRLEVEVPGWMRVGAVVLA